MPAKKNPIPPEHRLSWSVETAADMCDVSSATIREWVAAGVLRRVPYTTRFLIARAELERFLNSRPVVEPPGSSAA